jgi:hypothetical protein
MFKGPRFPRPETMGSPGPQRYSSGQRMSVRLSNDDCCAVDLILERDQTGTQGIPPCFTAAPSDNLQQRLTRVEQILHLLDHHTPIEPAEDLLHKTLARCEQKAPVNAPGVAAQSIATAR